MKLYTDKLEKIHGYEEGTVEAIDTDSAAIAADYKKNFLKEFISISPQQIDVRMGGELYYVTRKYDGEYAIIFYDNGTTVTINRSGRVRRGIACIEEAGKLIKAAGIKQAIIPAEIYVADDTKKSRVNALIAALADSRKTDTLKLAVFDILQIDNQRYKPANYAETISKLNDIFGSGEKVHPVDMEIAVNNKQIKEIFAKWVEGEGSEGLVVRSEMPFVFKIKPRHSIDVVVIGFTEGTGNQKGQVRTLLLALMPEEGKYQVVGRIGGGMLVSLKKQLYKKFIKTVINSEFIDTDSNHVAFHMIQPETVLEVSVNDLIYEGASGSIMNTVLEIVDGTYKINSSVEGFSFIAPLFERVRDDKTADIADIRLSQIDAFSYYNPEESIRIPETGSLPPSRLLLREVYRKQIGKKIMVQKYMVWKTNKEFSPDYPAYVLCYTNFSTERLEPLQREIKISNSEEQIMELHEKMLESNLKKGWDRVR